MKKVLVIFLFLFSSTCLAGLPTSAPQTDNFAPNIFGSVFQCVEEGVNIYISSTATGEEDGSIAKPYNSFSDLNWTTIANHIATGTRVYINLQGTFTDLLTIAATGSSSARIVIQGYGTGATINTSETAGIFLINKAYITIQNLAVTGGTSHRISIARGCSYINVINLSIVDHTNTGVYVNARDDADSHDITIRNNTITGGSSNGIWLDWGDADGGEAGILYNITIRDNIISTNDNYGIRMFSADTTNDLAYNIKIIDNTIQNNVYAGIFFRDVTDTAGANLVSGNTVSGNSASSTLGGIHFGNTATITVEDNLVYSNQTNGIDGRGIYFDTNTTDFICQRNIVYDHVDYSTPPQQSAGISVTDAQRGVIAFNTTSANDAGITVGGATTVDIEIYHNTVFNNTDRGISINSNMDSSEITIKNNILDSNTTYAIYDGDGSHEPVIDYNCYYGNGTDLYQIASKGSNSITSDPTLTAAGKLNEGSPALNTGQVISGINNGSEQDIWGNITDGTPNVGAYQGTGE